jgi:diguanylate cyclase (GGDEF)-like protein
MGEKMNESVLAMASKSRHGAALQSIELGKQMQNFCALLGGSQFVSSKLRPGAMIKNRKVRGEGNGNGNGGGYVKKDLISPSDVDAGQVRELLASCLDVLDVGLEIWDEKGRLALYNKKINQLQIGFHSPENIGKTFKELLHINVSKQLIKLDHNGEEEWLSHRFSKRHEKKQPMLHELADDRWANTYETRTPENYMVVAWVDVTELVRKGRILEAINRELFHQSTTDGLTGLANRRRFDEALANEQRPGNRLLSPISLLMVDVDHFKKYNDHYGHAEGDVCLRRVAAILDECARRTGDLVARYGGEEFVILLPGSDIVRARQIAQKCLDLMRDEAIPHANSPICDRVSLSLGIASFSPGMDLDGNLLLKAADSALYRAKTNGRVCYEEANDMDWNRNINSKETLENENDRAMSNSLSTSLCIGSDKLSLNN